MGWVFMLIAVIVFFLAGIGVTFIPNPMIWGLFCMALALLIGGQMPFKIGRS